jgi:hypothetical protein
MMPGFFYIQDEPSDVIDARITVVTDHRLSRNERPISQVMHDIRPESVTIVLVDNRTWVP